jgi:hypothetical protein
MLIRFFRAPVFYPRGGVQARFFYFFLFFFIRSAGCEFIYGGKGEN